MKYRFIPAFVMLLAGFICCIISIVQKWDVTHSLGVLAVVLVIFYILGQIFAQAIGKVVAEREAAIKAEKDRIAKEEAIKRQEEQEKAKQERLQKAKEAEMDTGFFK